MTTIERLKKTPKWDEFESWYNNHYNYGNVPFNSWYCEGDPKSGFIDLDFSFQKGVFERYLGSCGFTLIIPDFIDKVKYAIAKPLFPGRTYVEGDSFEALLIWFFNN